MNNYLAAAVETPLHHESIDEWIVETLCRRGALTLDYLNSLFPKSEETRLLFAIDRLSRAGRIVISPPQDGDYLLSADPVREDQAPAWLGRSCDESRALVQKAR